MPRDNYDEFEDWYFAIIKSNPVLEPCKNEVYDALQIQGVYSPITKKTIVELRFTIDKAWSKLQGF